MMIQSAPAGEPRFVCWMHEHNDLCGQFARAFGNEAFERCEPFDEMVYVVSHHDYGWDQADHDSRLDKRSGLPCGIGNVPLPGPSDTGRRSAEYNERHSAYCGLLASMHSWGLYNERYGFSEFRLRPGGPVSVPIREEHRAVTEAMLDAEIERQKRLRAELAADPAMRPWVEEKRLVQSYKQLQFFDTLALYFHLRHESERGREAFVHVPKTADVDADVTVEPRGGGVYALSPFPFAGSRLETTCSGRYFTPYPEGKEPADLGEALRAMPRATQTYNFVPA